MKVTNPIHILVAFFLAAIIKGDEDIVAVDEITCDPSCTDCLTLNGYHFESGGVKTDDFIAFGESSALVAEGWSNYFSRWS